MVVLVVQMVKSYTAVSAVSKQKRFAASFYFSRVSAVPSSGLVLILLAFHKAID